MNNRRKEDRREAGEFALANPLPDINRAHRDCERECIELRSRVKQLESLLARCGNDLLLWNQLSGDYFDGGDADTNKLIAEIDAILPATEGDKDGV